jgi:DNA uptake protein ComE-like DNA-binding protein
MKLLRKSVSSLIGYDRRERRGTYILSVLLVVFLLVRLVAFRPGKIPGELPPLTGSGNDSPAVNVGGKVEVASASLFIFDPNTASQEQLQSLGLTERQARTLVNYRNSGARFRRPEDMGRVYGIDSATVAVLIPYINISDEYASELKGGMGGRTASAPGDNSGRNGYHRTGRGSSAEAGKGKAGYSFPSSTPASAGAGVFTDGRESAAPGPVDLNLCTAEDLVTLPGIGPVLSVRIIRYRSLLGGFVESSQLREVYGLDSSVVRMIESRLTVTLDSVRPLHLDSITFGDLARHPYLGYEAARRITRYRSVSKESLTLGAMVRSGVITPGQAERIAPYVMPSRGASGSDYEFISSKVLK